MNRADLVANCQSKRGAAVEQPFGPEVDVFKVMGKMFALIPVDADPPSISLKCDPVLAQILRENYSAVTPAYHMGKKYWNGVLLDGSVPDDEIVDWIDHSYDQVVSGLTRAQRKTLESLH